MLCLSALSHLSVCHLARCTPSRPIVRLHCGTQTLQPSIIILFYTHWAKEKADHSLPLRSKLNATGSGQRSERGDVYHRMPPHLSACYLSCLFVHIRVSLTHLLAFYQTRCLLLTRLPPLTLALSYFLSDSFSLSLVLLLTRFVSLYPSLSLTLTRCLSLSLTLTRCLSHSIPLSLVVSLSHSLPLALVVSLSHSLVVPSLPLVKFLSLLSIPVSRAREEAVIITCHRTPQRQ